MKTVSISKNRLTRTAFDRSVSFLESEKHDFDLILTNYTTEIKSGLEFIDRRLVTEKTDFKTFALFKKLNKEVENSGLEIPEINPEEMEYYAVFKGLENGFYPEVVNVDIKAAYLTALKNYGYISAETYTEIMTNYTKKQRLKVTGMFASEKLILKYVAGEFSDYDLIRNEKSGLFFMCVQVVNSIMKKCAEIAGNDFLFFWVDGIYLKNNAKTNEITRFLIENNFNYSIEYLNTFSIDEKKKGDKSFKVASYYKGNEKKVLALPPPDNAFQRQKRNEFFKRFGIKHE